MNLKNGQTMETKQTAVDYLIQEIIPSSVLPIKYINEIIANAKAMEKEQICYAYLHGMESILEHRDEEDYYNETYGN